jgi:hypothetical protein
VHAVVEFSAPAAVTGLDGQRRSPLRSGRCEVAGQAGEGAGRACLVQFASRVGSERALGERHLGCAMARVQCKARHRLAVIGVGRLPANV